MSTDYFWPSILIKKGIRPLPSGQDELFCRYVGSVKLLICPAGREPPSPQSGSPSSQCSPRDDPDQPWRATEKVMFAQKFTKMWVNVYCFFFTFLCHCPYLLIFGLILIQSFPYFHRLFGSLQAVNLYHLSFCAINGHCFYLITCYL